MAGVVAVLFGIHPMHVESVAWATERKDVLFTFFYLLSLIAYLRYSTNDRRSKWYWRATLMLFIFSILSKSAAVTLPAVLCLMDFFFKRPFKINLIIEKIPLIIISFIFSLIAFVGALTPSIDVYPVGLAFQELIKLQTLSVHDIYSGGDRIFLVFYALWTYVYKLFWTTGLCRFIPILPK